MDWATFCSSLLKAIWNDLKGQEIRRYFILKGLKPTINKFYQAELSSAVSLSDYLLRFEFNFYFALIAAFSSLVPFLVVLSSIFLLAGFLTNKYFIDCSFGLLKSTELSPTIVMVELQVKKKVTFHVKNWNSSHHCLDHFKVESSKKATFKRNQLEAFSGCLKKLTVSTWLHQTRTYLNFIQFDDHKCSWIRTARLHRPVVCWRTSP